MTTDTNAPTKKFNLIIDDEMRSTIIVALKDMSLTNTHDAALCDELVSMFESLESDDVLNDCTL